MPIDNPHSTSLPFAEPWSLTLGLVGKGLVYAGVLGFLISALLWFLAKNGSSRLEKLAKVSFWVGALGVFGAFASLATLFVREQFQYEYIFGHSAAGLPVAYRVASVWSGQQGSFLLWATTSTIFALLVSPFTGKYRRGFTIVYALILASLTAILAYETPFNIIKDAIVDSSHVMRPPTGNGLTPALQNYWVIIHPPTIFMGFGSLTVMFAWAISAMLLREPLEWIKMVRPWAILSAAILGLGLCMGGFWAYETLGWGGFWAWDPVENVSFVPWIFTIAFYHGIIVQAAKGRWIGTNLLLGGIPFVVFTFGTLMTRSGLLGDSSVHSFAEMNRFALWILAGIMFASGGALFGLWVGRGLKMARDGKPAEPAGIDRESAYVSGVLLLSLIGLTAALGMAWSFFTGLFRGKAAVVEAHDYQVTLVWMFVPLLLLLAVAPFIGWRAQPARVVLNRLANSFGIALGITGVMLWLFRNPLWGAGGAGQTKPSMVDGSPMFEHASVSLPFGIHLAPLPVITFFIFLAAFTAVANLWRIAESLKRSTMSIGGFISHIGVAVLLAGLIVSKGLEHHEISVVPKSHPTKVLDYELAYQGMTKTDLEDRNNQVKFTVSRDGQSYTATPGLYYLPNTDEQDKAMVWPDIQHHLMYDTYLSVGAPQLYATEKPMTMKLGETQDLGTAKVKFVNWHAPKNPSAPNAQWTADLKISIDGKSFNASPAMVMLGGGLKPTLLQINSEVYVAIVGMNAEDGSITLQWPLVEPRFPVEFFYKPMTGLVWAGAGILCFGGLLSAFYRRYRRVAVDVTSEDDGTASEAVSGPVAGRGDGLPSPSYFDPQTPV